MTANSVAKLMIQETANSSKRVKCAYNPTSISITKVATWAEASPRGGRREQTSQYTGTKPRTLTIDLLLEGWSSDHQITRDVETLYSWTKATAQTSTTSSPTPPIVKIVWGQASAGMFNFDAYVKSVTVNYQMFDDTGRPVRAMVNLSLEETPTSAENQNPTSGGVAGRREHSVVAGESLQSVSYKEYNRVDYWRAIARANNVDDPLRLEPGRTLLIPPVMDAAALMDVADA
jgi:hypothetical protein